MNASEAASMLNRCSCLSFIAMNLLGKRAVGGWMLDQAAGAGCSAWRLVPIARFPASPLPPVSSPPLRLHCASIAPPLRPPWLSFQSLERFIAPAMAFRNAVSLPSKTRHFHPSLISTRGWLLDKTLALGWSLVEQSAPTPTHPRLDSMTPVMPVVWV